MAAAQIISHWHTLLDDFSTSSLEWYSSLEEKITARQIPDIRMERIEHNESGIGSAKRTYLRVTRGKLIFDVCAAPFGTSFFFSWWLLNEAPQNALLYGCLSFIALPIILVISMTSFGIVVGTVFFLIALIVLWAFITNAIKAGTEGVEDLILALPLWGTLYARWWKPVTYFTTDTRLMFQESIHRAVLEAIEGLRSEHGLRALSADERRPDMRDLLS